MSASNFKPRYRFAEFVVSPSRRLLLHRGLPVPLIPRYFDLLLLLLERRNEAVHRRDILESVWSDVVVSDGALNQAVRVLRRVLGDDPRSPIYIRTVSRHGYRFIHEGVVEEADAARIGTDTAAPPPGADAEPGVDERIDLAVERLLDLQADDGDRREAAETLHGIGTAVALRRIERLPGSARARAVLRDTRWEVPGAGRVPIFGHPGALATAWFVVVMRLQRAVRLAGRRWAAAVLGGGLAGMVAGGLGGVLLRFGPGAFHVESVLIALPAVGASLGALAACGVGGGLALAEAVVRTWRGPALAVCGAAGGALIGGFVHWVGFQSLQSLFGGDLSRLAGGFEGLVLGGATGLGYALATPTTEGGMATPRGRARWLTAGVAGLACAVAAGALAWSGSYLGAMSLEFVARSFPGSDVSLHPMARLLGESRPGPITSIVVSASEGFLLGFGMVFGLTRRPR
jgi:DNA-binding winged helix-turn-helix (wHTH) protein